MTSISSSFNIVRGHNSNNNNTFYTLYYLYFTFYGGGPAHCAPARVTKKKKGFQNVLLRTHQENEIQWSIVRLSSPSP